MSLQGMQPYLLGPPVSMPAFRPGILLAAYMRASALISIPGIGGWQHYVQCVRHSDPSESCMR